MGTTAAQTIEEALFWQYAALMAQRVYGPDWKTKNRAFQMAAFKKLRDGSMQWSDTTRDQDRWERELLDRGKPFCVYCGASEPDAPLEFEHMIPRVLEGPGPGDDLHSWNRVRACRSCNQAKGTRGLYAWKGYEERHSIRAVAEGPYLKLLHRLHVLGGTGGWSKEDLRGGFCSRCPAQGVYPKCPKGGPVKVIEVICAEAVALHGGESGS